MGERVKERVGGKFAFDGSIHMETLTMETSERKRERDWEGEREREEHESEKFNWDVK